MLSKPWTRLYIILPLAIGFLLIQHELHLSPAGHKVALLVVTLLIYALVALWVKSNTRALEDETYSSKPEQQSNPQGLSIPESAVRRTTIFQHEAGND
ncbi:MAG TPA: hypothetical protein VHP83_14340 [Aggregatilineaceae bacterium]|nr:hypothetical protein [Aggregatilineaceae bacterium]